MSRYESFKEETDGKKQNIISIIKSFSKLPPGERAKKEIELDELFTNLEETITKAENDQSLLGDTPPEEKDTFLKSLKKEIHKMKADHNRMSRRLSERTILFGQAPEMETEAPRSPTREKKNRAKQEFDNETLQELNSGEGDADPTQVQESDDVISKIFGKGKKRIIIISAITIVLILIVLAFVLYAVLSK